jgi:hypothetical protein
MEGARLVFASRGEGVEGFPAILNEMLWRGNFSYRPTYAVYARGIGPGLVCYIATLSIPKRLVEGVTEPHRFQTAGTSVEMVVQAMAYLAIGFLRSELAELEHSPFTHFPIYQPEYDANTFVVVPSDATLYEKRMSEMVRAQDRMIQCLKYELDVTRARLTNLQYAVEPQVRMGLMSYEVLYGAGDETPHELAPPSFRFWPVQGEWVPQYPRGPARATTGLRVRRFVNTTMTPTTLLGGPENLRHDENLEDTGSPGHHLLNVFPVGFVRAPYE